MLRRLVLLSIIFSLGLTACGGGDDDTNANNQDSQPISVTATLSFSVDLVLWHSYDDQRADALEIAAEGFNDGSISVSLEYHAPETIKSDYEQALRSGNGPDILVAEQQWLSGFADQRLIYPIDETVVNIIQSNFPVTAFHSFYYQDQVVAAPLWADMLVLYTNSTLIDEAPTSIDDLIVASTRQPFVLYPGVEGTAGLYNDSSSSFFLSIDGDLIFFKPNFVSYLRLYRRLLAADGITFSDDPTDFISGEAGGFAGFASDYQRLEDALGDDLQVSLLPANNLTNWRMFSYFTPLVISQNSPDTNIAAANVFFAYLLSPEIQTQMAATANRIPLDTTSEAALNDAARIGFQQLQWAHSRMSYPLFYDVVLPELTAILDEISPSTTDNDLGLLADRFLTAVQE